MVKNNRRGEGPMMNAFKNFSEQRQFLLSIIDKIQSVFSDLEEGDLLHAVNRVMNAKERLINDTFRVLVLGEFKRGKSTFINAMLGEEVLPAFATPCTAVINEVKWGNEKKACLHFRNPLPESLPKNLHKQAQKHIESYRGTSILPMHIEFHDLEEFVTIKDTEKEVLESPFEYAEIFWPLELCKNRVEIIDSPGLNEHQTRTEVTKNYLLKVDAVLFVMSCQALCSESEMKVIRELQQEGHKNIFFIANRFDQVRERERERLKEHAYKKLEDCTDNQIKVHFLSAADALDARLQDKDPDVLLENLEKSGMLELERKLQQFLVEDRGRIKLLLPVRETMSVISHVLQEDLPRLSSMLEQRYDELKARYESVQPRFEKQKRKCEQILLQLERETRRLQDEVELFAERVLNNIASYSADWSKDLKLEKSFSILSFSSKQQLEEIAKEVMNKLQEKAKEHMVEWRVNELQPLVEKRAAEMIHVVEKDIQTFILEVDALSSYLSGMDVVDDKDEISPVERILSAAGGFLVGGVGSAFVGVTFGYQEMLKSLIPNIAIGAVMIGILGITNPWILIPMLFGAGTLQSFLKSDKIQSDIIQKSTQSFQERLLLDKGKMSKEIAGQVVLAIKPLLESVGEGMRQEMKSIEDQVKSTLHKLKQGETVIQKEKEKIKFVQRALQEERGKLDHFLFEVVEGKK